VRGWGCIAVKVMLMSHLKTIHFDEGSFLDQAASLYLDRWGDILKKEFGTGDEREMRERIAEQHSKRVERFKEGQIGIVGEDGNLVGTIYSTLQRSAAFPKLIGWGAYGPISQDAPDFDANGDAIICYAIQTHRTASRGAGRLLTEAEKKLAEGLNKELFVFTRPNGLYKERHPDIDSYLTDIVERGVVKRGDTVSFHYHLGAELAPLLNADKAYLPNSRPADIHSGGYNVLMHY
jgi:hypothetical protein